MTLVDVKKVLTDAGIDFTGVTKLADLKQLAVDNGLIEDDSKPNLVEIAAEAWKRVTYPNIPKVTNPVSVRAAVTLPAGEHVAKTTGVTFAGKSKKGNELAYVVFEVDGFGEVPIMVTAEELRTFAVPGIAVKIDCVEPREGYTQVRSLKAA